MIRILVVEDHELVRDAVAALLRETPDIDVVGVASSIRDALPLLDRHNPDVVLADLSLEDGSGMELVRALRRDKRKGRVVIMTGFVDLFAAAEAIADGAAGYLLKAQSSRELVEAIRAVAAGRSYVAPAIAARLSERQGGLERARPDRRTGLSSLSPREHEVFLQVVAGHRSKDIAQRLCISEKTVETHRTNMNRKLAVRTTADLIRYAVARGISVAPRVSSGSLD